jgi:hypothetical protein
MKFWIDGLMKDKEGINPVIQQFINPLILRN